MTDLRNSLERMRDGFAPPDDAYERLVTRRARRRRGQRLGTAVVALAVAAAGIGVAARAFLGAQEAPRPTSSPTVEPVSPRVAEIVETGWSSAVVHGFGSVWVAEQADDGDGEGALLRMDPATGEIVARVPAESLPGWEWGGGGLAVGNGSVWIAGSIPSPDEATSETAGSDAALFRVDPVANQVVETIPLGGDFAADVAVTADGIWANIFRGQQEAELVRVDPTTLQVVARIPLASSYVRDLLTAGGYVWVQENPVHGSTVGSDSSLEKIDPATNEVVATVDAEAAKFGVFGGDIWALTGKGFVRIDVGSEEPVGDPSPAGDPRFGANLAADSDGLWFTTDNPTQEDGLATISRFLPSTGEVDASVTLPPETQTPIAMAVAGDSLWVVDYDRKLVRIALEPA
jgi:hypothetical protein